MAIKITLDSFLAVLKRSNLLSEEQVTSALEKFRAAHPAPIADAKPFAEFLVRNKVLTVWQAEKVLQGKHKGFFLGRYRLLSLLGKGGMSSVYLAEHTVMKRRCALKVLPAKRVNDASYLGRFHREAQAVAALDHPNIVRAYDVDMTTDAGIDIHFLSMEFVQGKSLLEQVQEKGLLPVAEAAEYIRQAAEGLDHAHKAGLVHRDVKPGNLLITHGGVIKILDLGLARFFNDEEASLTVQHDEKVLGTADYISPEQAIDSHKVDLRTDIYSLGCTLYFLLSGHPPFNSGSLAQRLVAHQTKPAPPISAERPDVPASLIAIMDKMMAKKVEDRYQSAQEVAQAMTAWMKNPDFATAASHAVVAPKPPVPAPSTPRPKSEPAAAKAAAPAVPAKEVHAARQPAAVASAPPAPPAAEPVEDMFGFLNQVDEAVPPAAATPVETSESEGARSSSRRLAEAAKETANLQQSPTAIDRAEPVAEDVAFEQAFDPSLLKLEIGPDESVEIGSFAEPPAMETAEVASKPRTKTIDVVAPKRTIPSKQLMLVSGVVAVLLVTAGVWIFWGQGGQPAITPAGPVDPKSAVPTPVPVAATPTKQATPDLAVVEVGPDGHFATVGAAIDYIRKNFQALSDTDTRTIQLKSGVTFTESLTISSSSSSYFPRNVTLKSSGSPPAIIQGDGKQPALTLQDVESLTVEGVNFDGNSAPVAVKLTGYQPATRLLAIKVHNFGKAAVLLEDLSAAVGQECVIDGLRVSANAPEAVGVRCQASQLANIKSVQIRNSRIVGPLKSGIEVSGFFWNNTIADSVIALCSSGIRFDGGLIDNATLVNNTLYKNDLAISFTKRPGDDSKNLKVQQILFSGSKTADVVLESGDVAGLAEILLNGPDGRRLNRSDRKEPDPRDLDVFAGDGQRGVSISFVSVDPTNPDYLKANADQNVPNPAAGAKGYVGAIAP